MRHSANHFKPHHSLCKRTWFSTRKLGDWRRPFQNCLHTILWVETFLHMDLVAAGLGLNMFNALFEQVLQGNGTWFCNMLRSFRDLKEYENIRAWTPTKNIKQTKHCKRTYVDPCPHLIWWELQGELFFDYHPVSIACKLLGLHPTCHLSVWGCRCVSRLHSSRSSSASLHRPPGNRRCGHWNVKDIGKFHQSSKLL